MAEGELHWEKTRQEARQDKLTRLRKEQERGIKAQVILEDPLFIDAVEAVKAELVDIWKGSSFRDRENREEAWRMYKGLDKVVSKIEAHMTTGRLATNDIPNILKWMKK